MTYVRAATLATVGPDTKIKDAVSDIGRRMENLLRNPPRGVGEGHESCVQFEPRAEWSPHKYFTITQKVLRVEVCVDLERVGSDPAYQDALVRDARQVAVDFLKSEEQSA